MFVAVRALDFEYYFKVYVLPCASMRGLSPVAVQIAAIILRFRAGPKHSVLPPQVAEEPVIGSFVALPKCYWLALYCCFAVACDWFKRCFSLC